MNTLAVFLDFDGVLVDSMTAHARAWVQMLSEYGIEEDELLFYLREGEKADVTIDFVLQKHGIAMPPEERHEMVERKRAIYHAVAPRGLMPEARKLVEELRRRDIALTIVTGSNRRNIDRTVPLEDQAFFTRIITADNYTSGKPAPDPYLAALVQSGAPRERCRILENAPLGIRSGKAAQIFTVAIMTSLPAQYLTEADQIIQTYPEFLNYL